MCVIEPAYNARRVRTMLEGLTECQRICWDCDVESMHDLSGCSGSGFADRYLNHAVPAPPGPDTISIAHNLLLPVAASLYFALGIHRNVAIRTVFPALPQDKYYMATF